MVTQKKLLLVLSNYKHLIWLPAFAVIKVSSHETSQNLKCPNTLSSSVRFIRTTRFQMLEYKIGLGFRQIQGYIFFQVSLPHLLALCTPKSVR